jgi:exosortase
MNKTIKNKSESIYKDFLREYWQEISAFIVLILAYLPTMIWMWDRWFARDSYYSHGFLVPLVSLYLIWQKKDELRVLKKESSKWGLRLIVLGTFFYLISSLLRIYFSSGFSFIIVFYGLILHFFGEKIFKKILFPLFFLVFMIPLPLVIIRNISFRLKIFAAIISAQTLNAMRIPALREGSIIKMRSAHVTVDDVCSGLRSLISLTALGSIFAYWMKGSAVKKVLVFLSTIPIAIITNVCRVVLLSSISEIWGPQYAVGFIHDASGFMVFALAFILLYAVVRIIE